MSRSLEGGSGEELAEGDNLDNTYACCGADDMKRAVWNVAGDAVQYASFRIKWSAANACGYCEEVQLVDQCLILRLRLLLLLIELLRPCSRFLQHVLNNPAFPRYQLDLEIPRNRNERAFELVVIHIIRVRRRGFRGNDLVA